MLASVSEIVQPEQAAISKKDVCAILVTYFPDDDFCARLSAVQSQVSRIVIVDNSASDQVAVRLQQLCAHSVVLLENNANLGLAAGLNRGVAWARKAGYRWAFLLDQDTTAKEQHAWFLWTALSLMLVSGTLVSFSMRKRNDKQPVWLHAFTTGCLSSLGLGMLLLIYWVPLYDKLWLQPLWVLVLLVFVRSRYVVPPRESVRFVLVALGILFATINLTAAFAASHGPWPNFDEANRVQSVIQPGDLVITDWSSVAVLYRQIWAGDAGSFDFTALACGESPHVLQEMQTRISEAQAGGGQIYFLGMLDLKKPDWDGFLGAHCQIPFENLQLYREQSQTVATFQSDGRTVSLRRFNSFVPTSAGDIR
ncbi:MAG TPA: glycosyltransferase [Terriglobales bacterium]|nr:glycosyltransferase [Terriglobales bacterium]